MRIEKIMKRLAATDGKKGTTWDMDVLMEFAVALKRGVAFGVLGGGPEMKDESDRFKAEWNAIQAEIGC